MSGEQPDLESVDAKVEDSSTAPPVPEAVEATADSTTAQEPEDPKVVASSSDVAPSSSTTEGSSAAVSTTPYGSLAYAPRQPSSRSIQTSRPVSQSSALLDSGSSTPLPPSQAPLKPLSNEPPADADSTVPTQSSSLKDDQASLSLQSSSTAPVASASDKRKIDVQKALDDCLAIGLGEASPGYALVKQLMEGTESEWNALTRLVGEGEATLLLPVATRSSSKGTPAGPHEPPTLAYAYDHVLLSPSVRPSSSASDFGDRGVATLSGLRGSIDTIAASGETTSKKQKLVIKSFVNRTDQAWSKELRNKDTRGQFLSRLAPLPQACCIDYPYPNYSLLAEQTIELPGPSKRSRAVSGSSALTAPALGLGSSATPASFASLFGGAGRDKRKSTVASGSTSATGDEASDSPRKINVWLIDRPLRRSRALRGMTHSIQARLTVELKRRAAIDPAIGDLVGALAAEFYPVVESSSSKSPPLASTSSSRSSSLRLSRSSAAAATSQFISNSPLPLYAVHPDEITNRYQDLCSSIHGQLGGTVSDEAASALLDKMEVVEELLIGEIYDRLISPPQGPDQRADDNLASRIAALNILGLDWQSLGLKLPKEQPKATDDQEGTSSNISSSEVEEILTGLQIILEECQATLSNLEQERTPRAKLDLLVAIHRSVVDGLAKLPKIDLQGDVEQNDAKSQSNDPTGSSTPSQAGNTSSADLILPILIRLLVKASPPAICSQLLFLQRYRYEALLKSSGETAYCLINFQAAVQFIENAKPSELGLEGDMTGSQDTSASTGPTGRSAAMEMLKNVQQDDERNSVTQNEPVLIGTRIRGLTGVVNSSFSVLGRVMSSGASAGMDAWDRSSRMDTVRSLEDIRGLLSTGLTRSAASGSNLAKMLREKEQEGNQGEPAEPSPLQGQASSSARAAGAVPRAIATKSTAASSSTVAESVAPMGSPTSTRDPNKLSLSDRLARLNWNPSAGGTPGASSPAIEAPQPNQFVPSSVAMGANQRSFSGGTLNLPSGQAGSVADDEESLPASLRSPYPPLSKPPTAKRPLHVLLATSGSVASVKLPLIVKGLLQHGNVRVQVVATKNSMHFYDSKEVMELAASDITKGGKAKEYTLHDLAEENRLAALGQNDETLDSSSATPPARPPVHLWTDADEWSQFTKIGDPILHIELRRWADVVLIAPCSANTLAKISNGICDDLLTSLLRALSSSTPTWLFPAMNTLMYRHPLTARQLSLVQDLLGYEVFGPIEKKLACGDLGKGAMYEWTDIVGLVKERFGLQEKDQKTEAISSEVQAS